jgi:pilus assembly protein Flp/PilA
MKSLLEDFFLRLYTNLLIIIRSERGQTLVEYALLVVLIAIVVYLMLKGSGLQINNTYSKINSALATP